MIKKDKPNVDTLIKQFEELKEKEFFEKNGMSTADYQLKIKQEIYESETVNTRTCICEHCHFIFDSDRLYPSCTNCNKKNYSAIEKIDSSSLIGKEIKEVFASYDKIVLIFTDNTFETLSFVCHE